MDFLAQVTASASFAGGTPDGNVFVGLDSTTTRTGINDTGVSGSGTTYFGLSASLSQTVAVGYHYLAWLERGRTGSTSVFWGDGGFNINSGMYAEIKG